MTGETKRDEFKEIEEMIRKILECSLGTQGETLPAGFRIIVTGGEITGGKDRSPLHVSRQVVEPAVEVYVEGDTVRILTEVPGADLTTTHLQITGKTLRIYADGGECRYHTSLELPRVESESMTPVITHGVLEVTFRKAPIRENIID